MRAATAAFARRAGSAALAVLLVLVAAGCATDDRTEPRPMPSPAAGRALISRALPTGVADRAGWSTDIYAAMAAMQIPANAENVCAVVAVTEQESTFRANPTVPNLSAIAWKEIDEQADRLGIPSLVVRTALRLDSSNGKSYAERIDAATTELELSDIFEDMIGRIPMGKRLFADRNPVRTGGPMQVGIAFAEKHVASRPYPYPLGDGGVRREVFTRRGGMYFGIAHLLDYPASYAQPIFRFADFNAGHYASRNAAFQNAVTIASGIPLDLDGDLVDPGNDGRPGSTELATRVLAGRLGMNDAAIRRGLELEKSPRFETSDLWRKVFALADQAGNSPAPRAVLPRIVLRSPKITRKLTTEWFANRVDERYRRCLTRASTAPAG